MSTLSFLTLAITEVDPKLNNYFVVVMEERSQNICQLELTKDQIITPTGKAFWDIGFTTHVNGKLKDKINSDIQNPKLIEGTAELVENRIISLKKLFEAKSAMPDEFFENPNKKFGIMKVEEVLSIYKKDYPDRTSHYLKVSIYSRTPQWKDIVLLNKDYRWKNYWEWVSKNGDYAKRSKEYQKLFNESNKAMYLVLHKHRYPDGTVRIWILGMHWL